VPVGREGGRRQIAEVGATELVEQVLTEQRLHLGAIRLDHVTREAAGARLGHRSLQHLLAARAPQFRLDAVPLLERGGQGHRVLRIQRRVDDDDPFLARAGEHALLPIGGLELVDASMRRLRRRALRACHRRGEQHAEQRAGERAPIGMFRGSAARCPPSAPRFRSHG
jgi:hypothetical protein